MIGRCIVAVMSIVLVAADAPPPQAMRQSGAEKWFGELTLIDQDSHRVSLYEDLMARHVVVVNAFYTGCRAACPQVMGTLADLRRQVAIDGPETRFISITVDPEHDTPDRLALYARTMGADADWRMLSGDPISVHAALHKLGLDVKPDDPVDHLNVLYMANLRTGLWVKAFSLTPLDSLVQLLQRVDSDPGP
jgi:cytochrome oxidase Cu insertion factor (SCO1/SenC/PrrC family)